MSVNRRLDADFDESLTAAWQDALRSADKANWPSIEPSNGMENMMDVGLVSKPAYPTKSRNFHENPSPSEPATAGAALRLTVRASLMLALLLSLGLWAVIWALASAALR